MFYEKKSDEKAYYYFFRREHNSEISPYFTPPHFHEGYELLFIFEGEGEIVLNGEPKTLRAGDIVFLNSYDIHSFVFKKCVRYTLVFSKDYCRMLAIDDKTLPSYPVCDKEYFDAIIGILDNYFSLYENKIPNSLTLEGLVATVLGIIEDCSGRIERPNGKKELMVLVLEYISKNFSSELTLESVASRFGYSQSHFSTLFNKFAQMNFKNYLSYVRYTNAVKLIEEGGCSATEAAIRCGFGSMNTFYRAKNKFSNGSSFS